MCWLGGALALAALGARARRHPAPILEPALLRIRSFGDRQRVDAAALGRLLRAAAGQRPLPHARLGLLGARGRLRRHSRAARRDGRGGHRRKITERRGPRACCCPRRSPRPRAACSTGRVPGRRAGVRRRTGSRRSCVSGAAFGFAFAALATATVMDLPPNRLATGTALSSCARQIGAVLGIAVLVAVLGTPAPAEAPAAFDEAWLLMAVALAGLGHRRDAAAAAARPRRSARARRCATGWPRSRSPGSSAARSSCTATASSTARPARGRWSCSCTGCSTPR